MLLQPINRFVYTDTLYSKKRQSTHQYCCDLPRKNYISFEASTSAGNPFKRLKNVPDAFFGGITINGAELDKIKKDLVKCNTVKKAVQYLKKYKPKMLKIESRMFERFENAAKDSPRMQFQDLLKQWYNEAIIKLKLEEFAVIDDIDKISLKMSPETTFAIRKETTDCRRVIIENNPNNTFKRKTVLDALKKITPKPGEEKIMQTLMDRAVYLPSSATSENAFIVKYANRSHNEISNRLVSSALLSIDHLKAAASGGENDIGNFIPVSAGANSLKQDMWFKKFIKRFPEIVENCQKFIDYMIDIINHGGFKGNQAYPYKVRKTLIHESNGKVKLDLSELKYTKEEAIALEKAAKKNKGNV